MVCWQAASKVDLSLDSPDLDDIVLIPRTAISAVTFKLMRKSLSFFLFLILTVMLVACAPEEPANETAQLYDPETGEGTRPWWGEAIFYEIFVRSFYDSDGDGIGDLNGITEKLDYLEELGVTAIWLMPIHPSPSYHGYDVTNYYAVNPEYGTKEDLVNLVNEAHRRNMRIIIDLVLNHTSSQHPFFRDANSGPDSAYRDWYIWSDDYPGWGANYWHEGNQGYYYGFFWGGMPDLNYNNPEVSMQMEQVIHYWVNEIGIDGFRLDAIKHLIENEGVIENTPATHEWLRDFYESLRQEYNDVYLVGEVFGAGGFIAKSYSGDQLDHVFNFELASGYMNSVNGESNTGINSAFILTLKDMPDGNYATFLTNHDQNRVMSVLRGNTAKAKLAASLLLTSPGTPFIYYGEEIGMLGVKPDPDIRLPMQWTSGPFAGFSRSDPWRVVPQNYPDANVADQQDDADSLLSHYRQLINLRKNESALRKGRTEVLETGTTALFANVRFLGDEAILILINLTDELMSEYALEIDKAVIPEGNYALEPLMGSDVIQSLVVDEKGMVSFNPHYPVPPYSTLLLKFTLE